MVLSMRMVTSLTCLGTVWTRVWQRALLSVSTVRLCVSLRVSRLRTASGSVTVRDNFYGVVRWFADCGSFCIVRCPNLTVGECHDHDKMCFALCDERLQVSEIVGNIHETEWKQYGEYFQEVLEKEVRND